MIINVEAIANGFVMVVHTQRGVTKVYYSIDDYEKMQREMTEIVSEYVASLREFLAQQNKSQD